MTAHRAYLHGFGAHAPDRVVTNAELAGRLNRTAEWIESASGIRERRWAAPETSVADLAVRAAEDCLARTGIDASTLGMLIVASGSGSHGFPGPAVEVATRLGMGMAPALDLPIASAGSLFGLAMAMRLAEAYGDILVIGTEKMSAVIHSYTNPAAPLDPNTAMLFGDGAGAALVSSRPGSWRLLDAAIHSDGQYRGDLAWQPAAPAETAALHMDGRSVILQASRKLPHGHRRSAGAPVCGGPGRHGIPGASGESQPSDAGGQGAGRGSGEDVHQSGTLRQHFVRLHADRCGRVVGVWSPARTGGVRRLWRGVSLGRRDRGS